jgi:hypothetical protein
MQGRWRACRASVRFLQASLQLTLLDQQFVDLLLRASCDSSPAFSASFSAFSPTSFTWSLMRLSSFMIGSGSPSNRMPPVRTM